ncbi:M4 family metallopeptidase [Tenacibaculum finnmarkense genomovar finnmarkense]|uniref:M4 family metallopeptidase n=1 Tax=Tenacibaculum finnmarkense TaxID=2781243 RepID=UPI001E32E038|nr:M4 family metallopeptidase [Tenacibaculum finnmarkense]MCD8416711.1 M4 family metallopeptidase [Tenacibaculum finnmarkense genomovar finnmarkense]MCG8184693.1 M4 family metallopeptidase [Tenacibaculum finnmarkense genomovar finnmarkense]MCG8201691.1 M4 family metallopeptidase [Tenacibaculum finnmarkense genomovar finnmarkense]MCG8208601.1 M4 family metallopeptidase [Tenacibaculum finnmarkense genomovar finnmarkense]MCG8211332.1 M4 family metallopeptidase [Tenacibaculum finnmarkense genomova
MNQNYLKMMFLSSFLLAGLTSMTAQESRELKQIKLEKSSKMPLQKAPDLIRSKLKLTSNDNLQKIKSEIDNLGFIHEKFQQKFKGVKVEFGTYTAHAKNSTLRTMDGALYDVGKVNIRPKLSKEAAFKKAIAHTGAQKYLWEQPKEAKNLGNYKKPTGELLILPREVIGTKSARLAYKFDIYTTKPLSRGDLYIDAHTGEALFFNATIKHLGEHAHSSKNLGAVNGLAEKLTATLATGNADTRYSGTKSIITRLVGNSYVLRDNTRGGGVNTYNSGAQPSYPTTDFTDSDNNWTAAEFNNSAKDNAALDAHWGAEMTYDYFQDKHNRNSYNGSGATINSYVHYDDVAGGTGYDNAFWNGSVMTYGDGSSNGNEGNGYFDALTSIDVAAHEIGHAVCSNTANLAYQRESGAMNEGFSDIWGAAVEHFAKGNGNDLAPDASVWLIGDEIDRRNGSSALRSMSNPNERNQPDTYGGVNWKEPNCGTPTRSNDYCGVHTNSGVLNYWFYLLTVGGSGTNDINNAFNVDAIGMEKSAKISYRLEANYLSANSTFEDARVGSITAAEDLYGANSIEVQSVTNAWHAVGVGQAYVEDCTLVAPSNFNATNINDNGFTVTWSAVSEAVSYTVTINEITSVVTDTSKVITGLVSGTIYNCSVAANCVSGEGGTITSKLITTTGEIPLNYCVSKANNVADEYIQKVVLGTIDNTSTASNGYSDYTSISTSLIKGESNTITITPKWNGTVYSEGYGVWIDYNKDGDFDDAGETVFTKAKSKTTPINGTFTIPESALNGATRMRVVLKYNATPTACETNIQYGEVEDYTVVIESPKSDTTAPTAPSNLSASNITQTSLILNWTAATDNVAVTGYDVYQGATKVASTNTTTATITGLISETNYAFSVKATDEEANISISSATLNVTTLAIPVSYCESKGTKISYEWIDYVAFGGMTNTTAANGGYGDFTSKVATVVQGTTNQLVLSAGFASSTYNEYFTVWIDYNKDGDFSDAGEQVTTGNSSSATNRVANIVIPENAKLGKTRMRVSMKYNSASTSCGTFGDGEVEDYTVNIIATSVINTVVTMSVSGENIKTKEASNLSIYPNPAVNFVHINVASKAKNTSYKIINITGSTVQKGRLNTAKLNVTNLSSGMYILEVYDGQKVLTTKLLKK